MNNYTRTIFILFLSGISLLQCKEDEEEVPPIVASFEPTSGLVGSEVEIFGGNFDKVQAVFINDVSADIVEILDNRITIIVPPGATSGKIKVSAGRTSTVTSDDFTVLNVPAITDVTPNEGVTGTEVVISGSNFIEGTTITFNGVAAEILSLGSNSITTKVPNGSWPGKIRVVTAAGSVESSDTFVANPPVIEFIQHRYLNASDPISVTAPGQKVTIKFENAYAPPIDQTKITFGEIEVENLSQVFPFSQPSTLWFEVPQGVSQGKFALTINGYTTEYDQVVTVPAGGSWKLSTPFPIPDDSKRDAAQFQFGSSYYFGAGSSVDQVGIRLASVSFYKFDCESETWSTLPDFPISNASGTFSFGVNDIGYVGGGVHPGSGDISYDLYQYDPSSAVWSVKSVIPANVVNPFKSFGFSVNGKGYVLNTDNGQVFEYDPVANEWSEKGVIPGTLPIEFKEDFVIDEMEYLAFKRSGSTEIEFWQFDAATSTWTSKTNYPGLLDKGCFSFVIENKGYIGSLEHFWKYDPLTDEWNRLQPYPGFAVDNLAAFSYGKKGYAGLAGYKNYNNWPYPSSNELYSFEIP